MQEIKIPLTLPIISSMLKSYRAGKAYEFGALLGNEIVMIKLIPTGGENAKKTFLQKLRRVSGHSGL